MNRREFISGIVGVGTLGSLSGCTEYQPPDHKNGVQRRISITDQAEIPATHQIQIDVDVLEPEVTNSHPAQIRVTTTNTGERRAISIADDFCTLFNHESAGSDNPSGLWLYRAGRTDSIDHKENRWSPDRSEDPDAGSGTSVCNPMGYESGASVTNDYEIWDDYRVSGYFDPGTYQWVEEVRIWDDPTADAANDADTSLTWQFSLDVKDVT